MTQASDPIPQVYAATLTDPGRKRALNEDSVRMELTNYGGIFVVADGMGGHNSGEVASAIAVDEVIGSLKNKVPSPQSLLASFETANEKIHGEGQSAESKGMGTTCTALWLDLPYALVAHVGDSRAYLLRDGGLIQLSQDHSWVADRVRQGLLTEEEARNHRWRNVITNALGSFPKAKVDLVGIKVAPGDVFLVCSDGLSGVLDDRVLSEIIFTNPPKDAVTKLISLANEWGGPDNITAIVVTVGTQLGSGSRPYSLPLETATGLVRLNTANDPDILSTRVDEPEKPVKQKANLRPTDWLLAILLVGILAYFLLNQNKNTQATPTTTPETIYDDSKSPELKPIQENQPVALPLPDAPTDPVKNP